MTATFIHILAGVCLATLIFKYMVSGGSDVTLRTWKGMLVYFLLGMGAVQSIRIVFTLLGGLRIAP